MIGPSSEAELRKISWPDASLRRITVDYDAVLLSIRQSNGDDRVLRADGYIGFNIVGFWDEIIIERVEILESHAGLDACVAAIRGRAGEQWLDSGNEARNTRRWLALLVHLIDGCTLQIFAAQLEVDPR